MSALHRLPLVIQVERQRACNALASFEQRAARNDEAEARHALYALVGTAYHEVDAQRRHVYGHSAKAAHRVHYQRLAVLLYNGCNVGQRIEHSGSGLAVNHRHVCRLGMTGQIFVYLLRVNGLSLLKAHHVAVQMIIVGYHAHTLSVGSVGSHEQMVVGLYHRTERSLNTEAAAALHQHRRIFFGAARRQLHELFAYNLNNAYIIVFVPCAPVAHHGFLNGVCGCQWSGCK